MTQCSELLSFGVSERKSPTRERGKREKTQTHENGESVLGNVTRGEKNTFSTLPSSLDVKAKEAKMVRVHGTRIDIVMCVVQFIEESRHDRTEI
jgi:hypothetical protein